MNRSGLCAALLICVSWPMVDVRAQDAVPCDPVLEYLEACVSELCGELPAEACADRFRQFAAEVATIGMCQPRLIAEWTSMPCSDFAVMTGASHEAQVLERAHVLAAMIGDSIEQFRLRYGTDPDSIEQLIEANVLHPDTAIDPWLREFRLIRLEDGHLVGVSGGPDHHIGTDDDVYGAP